jgi:hypothetical protein
MLERSAAAAGEAAAMANMTSITPLMNRQVGRIAIGRPPWRYAGGPVRFT